MNRAMRMKRSGRIDNQHRTFITHGDASRQHVYIRLCYIYSNVYYKIKWKICLHVHKKNILQIRNVQGREDEHGILL